MVLAEELQITVRDDAAIAALEKSVSAGLTIGAIRFKYYSIVDISAIREGKGSLGKILKHTPLSGITDNSAENLDSIGRISNAIDNHADIMDIDEISFNVRADKGQRVSALVQYAISRKVYDAEVVEGRLA